MLAIFAKGYLAVDFFFLLSGFVIWLSWGERLRLQGARAVPGFLRKRIARIWPLHLFVLGCALVLAAVFVATGRPAPFRSPLGELPLDLLLVHNWGFTDRLAWNDPSWSISAELAAYLLFPLLTWAIDWRRVPAPAVIAAVVALCVLLHAIMTRGGAVTLGTDIARFGLLRCILEFAAGTALCALWLRWRETPAAPALGALLAAASVAMLWRLGLPETLAVPLLFAALLLALALTSGIAGNPLELGLLHYLGEISYATYLGHFMLWVVFKLAFVDATHQVGPALVALYLTIVLLSSILLYHFVERPAQWLINDLHWPRRERLAIQLD